MLAGMDEPAVPVPHARLLAELGDLLRPDQIDTSDSALDLHARGESWAAVQRPDVVVYPESTEEVPRFVELALATHTPVTPVAVNSSLGRHTVPIHGGISLDLTRMDRIVEIVAEDFLAVVQPAVCGPSRTRSTRRGS
jgi:D-lactate dehydrogenase (cytochrome)